MRKLDIRRLEVFVQVVRCGTFTKAAEALFLAQPTVSQHIDALEKELGVALLERRRRKVTMTTAGRELYPYAIQILRTAEQGEAAVHHSKTKISGPLRIGASFTPGTYLLPYLMNSFRQAHPEAHFAVNLASTEEVISQLLAYEVDLALIGSTPDHSNLDITPVYQDELVLITPANMKYEQPITARELCQLPFVLRKPGSATLDRFMQALGEADLSLSDLKIKAQFNSLDGVINGIRAGLGVSVLSELCAKRMPDLQGQRIIDLDLRRQICLVRRRNTSALPGEDKLYQHICGELKK